MRKRAGLSCMTDHVYGACGVDALRFPDLDYEVHRAVLTPEQVREYGLPSRPLKETERRGDAWRTQMGDRADRNRCARITAARPAQKITRKAIKPFFDDTLGRRVTQVKAEWVAAHAVIDQTIDQDRLDRLRTEAEAELAELRDEINAVNNAVRLDASDFDLPPLEVPEAEVDGTVHPLPLLDSRWSFTEQCKALMESNEYRLGRSS
jgi:hypothetical protein